MQISSIRDKTLIVFLLIAASAIVSSVLVIDSLNQAEDDAEIVNALGRQRMLSQAMAKSVLGYALAKNSLQGIQDRIVTLDAYITQMRKVYTQFTTHPFPEGEVAFSQTPTESFTPALPFPATFTRGVNEAFQDQIGLSVDIIAERPVNPKKYLKTNIDRQAFAALSRNPDRNFTSFSATEGRLDVLIYSGDIATTESCAACHSGI
jgi:hypothetical protein